ncbi:phosphoglycolate phosphatase [Aeropyrum pernix]|uniref:Phosphoglycolate phosphatase n=1 Tax=Aeropyrum pernix TaxID=56636 RepID=A0A401HA56_AERPX|nr:phosphoglycolate phosphatase [Aeropyrum pernix]GBF09287.1 phosphoglycolate phosphatase [Aeropyrum pernix]
MRGLAGSVRVAALDIDGTLTERRGAARLDGCSIAVARLLNELGVTSILMTGNSLPVARGVAVYLGLEGPVVAENGCVAVVGGERVHICSGKPPEGLVRRIMELGFRPSWQNEYRYHEYSLIPVKAAPGIVERASAIVEGEGYRAIWSGYALHIQPPGGGKARGVGEVLARIGAGWSEVLAIGDGENDVEVLARAGYSGAPGDAAEQAKRAAKIVARSPGARGTLEIIQRVLGGARAPAC